MLPPSKFAKSEHSLVGTSTIHEIHAHSRYNAGKPMQTDAGTLLETSAIDSEKLAEGCR